MNNLTNTKWYFNEDINPFDIIEANNYNTVTFGINFTSNNQAYQQFKIDYYDYVDEYAVLYNSTEVNLNLFWMNQVYRTIEITGGSDATNTTFINWLQENATEVQKTVADELNKLQTNLTNAYTKLAEKGAVIPTKKNTDNLASAIESISGVIEVTSESNLPSTAPEGTIAIVTGE